MIIKCRGKIEETNMLRGLCLMGTTLYWWVLAAVFVIFALLLLRRNFAGRQNKSRHPVRKSLKEESDNEILSSQKDAVTALNSNWEEVGDSPENRKLDDTKGYIPLENCVVSEIPITKAETIGHLGVKNNSNKKRHKNRNR
jgi:hypothetical protein